MVRKFSLKPYRRPLERYKNGRIKLPSKTKYKWFTEPHTLYYEEKLGEYQPIKLTRFEATDNQIRTWLYRLYGFEFKTYTEKGTVKVDRDELESLGDYGKDLRNYLKLKKDLSQLGGTDNSLIATCSTKDQSIHGRVNTIGAATHRCVPMDYKIKTLSGYKSYEELTENDYIYSYSAELNTLVLSKLLDKVKYTDAITHPFTNGTLHFRCTKDHKWLTEDGLVSADKVKGQSKILL